MIFSFDAGGPELKILQIFKSENIYVQVAPVAQLTINKAFTMEKLIEANKKRIYVYHNLFTKKSWMYVTRKFIFVH